jgi:hypothetical protein
VASIDGSHYFLTALVPVRRAWVKGKHGQTTAPIIQLREKLTRMPTAMQTPERTAGGQISKFAQSTLTHFARFAVIDRLGFNGYVSADPVAQSLGLQRPVENREELKRPYLLFAAEFDAPSGSRSYDLAVYLRELWDVMQDDLVEIFQHCIGFDPAKINTAAEFINYIKACEIDTTMPFNAYYLDPPALPSLTARGLLIGAGAAGVVAGAGVWWLLHRWLPVLGIVVGLVAALAAAILFIGYRVKTYGERRFPPTPDGDLQTILKALYLQTSFGKFVIKHQAADDAALYDAFGRYLNRNKVSQPEPKHPAGRVVP